MAGKRGLTEAAESITIFVALCVWPEHFAVLVYGFAGVVCGDDGGQGEGISGLLNVKSLGG
jgi:hypothetical protein